LMCSGGDMVAGGSEAFFAMVWCAVGFIGCAHSSKAVAHAGEGIGEKRSRGEFLATYHRRRAVRDGGACKQ
jgi:hypothetical protein